MLREAFNKTVKDPDFLAETKKKRLDMDPTTGEEVQSLGHRSVGATEGCDRAVEEVDGDIGGFADRDGAMLLEAAAERNMKKIKFAA